MNFEDIFYKVRPVWKDSYLIDDIAINKTFSKEIAKDFDKNNDIFEDSKAIYSEWDSMMLFVMYQILTEYSLEQFYNNRFEINVEEIPLQRFESKYFENLQSEGNEDYFLNYKRFRSFKK